ncbi:hypothetical protein N9977_00145 [bacterium]|nr:hypothetical protein [bacterium]
MGGEVMKELESTDPLFIHEDEGYNTAVLSDMLRRDVEFDPSQYPVPEEAFVTRQQLEELLREGIINEEEYLAELAYMEDTPVEKEPYTPTPLELYVEEMTGMEPGLDRATFLPFAGSREEGNLELAAPALVYDIAKALNAPGVALRGEEITPEEVFNTAGLITAGSFGRPAVEVAGNEMLTGMAVRPKKAVVRPASTHRGFDKDPTTRRIEMEADDAANLQQYEELLETRLSEQGFDPAIVEEVVRKADKYFMSELGTADDPLRQAMLGGTLVPEFFESTHLTPGFWDREREALGSGLEDQRGFERAYDSASGVKRTLVDPRGDEGSLDQPALLSEAAQMLSEGVPRDLIFGTSGGYRGLTDDSISPLRLNVDTVYPHQPSQFFKPKGLDSMPGYLARAYEQGEMVYDIEPEHFDRGLNFLSPERLAEQLTAFSADEIRGRSFPDLVVEAQTRFLPPEIEQRKLARQIKRDSSSIGGEERNARVPTKFKTEVGVTSVYPMDDRTWYSLETDGAVELEGALMNHSVGGYSSQSPTDFAYSDWKKEDFADKRTLVFSLRDKDGRSRVTTDISFRDKQDPIPEHELSIKGHSLRGPRVLSAYGYNNADVPSEHLEELFALWKYFRIRPHYAMPGGVPGAGSQYMTYLQTGEVFGVQDALDSVDGQLPVDNNPDPGDMELAEGGIVSLVNGCGFNQRRGNN